MQVDYGRHKIFLEYWKSRTDYQGIAELPLFAHVQHVDFDSIAERGMTWDWKVEPMTALQYGAQMMAWTRASWTQEPNGGFNGVDPEGLVGEIHQGQRVSRADNGHGMLILALIGISVKRLGRR